MGHLYHGYVSHNQMVYLCHQYVLLCERYFPIFWHGRGPMGNPVTLVRKKRTGITAIETPADSNMVGLVTVCYC